MNKLIIILILVFSSNVYAPDVVLEPSERNPLSTYLDDTESLKGNEHIYFMRCVALQLNYIEFFKKDFGVDPELRIQTVNIMYHRGLEIMQENLDHMNKNYVKNSYDEFIQQYIRHYKRDMLENEQEFGALNYYGDGYLVEEANICFDTEAPFREF
ncbi:hypothetical protein OAN10_03335 [Alphaproteobacteria bacterium]|nr:hypothetical protein [Alphaproteobacteria bacterium]